MASDDRLRAKPPATDADAWSRGTVQAVAHGQGRVTVTVSLDASDAGSVDLSVTEAVYDLFTGRLEYGDTVDGEVAPGTTVWFRKTGE